MNHGLSNVDEVAVLRCPHNETFRRLHVITNFKTHYAGLAQGTIQNFKRGFDLRNGLHRNVTLICLDVIKSGMPLAEGAAYGILASQADGNAIFEDRGKG